MNKEDIPRSLLTLTSRADIPEDAKTLITSVVGEMRTPLQTDVWIYRIVVTVLGLIVLATVLGGIFISYIAKGDANIQMSEGIVAIGSAAVGALAGLLAPSPNRG